MSIAVRFQIQSALEKRLNSVNQYDVKRVITKATWAEIRTAYASGIGLREIARNMDIPEGTVLARAKRENWTREIQTAKAIAKREDAAPAVTASGSRRSQHGAA